jgi:RimJ/RimL family protein N-acetyltransferase
MNFVYGQNARVADFVASLIEGCERGFTSCTTIGVANDNQELIAGVVYHNWSPEAGVIEMSCAASTARWLNKSVMQTIFAYPFEEIGCQMVVMRVSDRNERMKRIFRALDFEEYLIPRLRGREEDEIIFTLTQETWLSNQTFKRCRNG